MIESSAYGLTETTPSPRALHINYRLKELAAALAALSPIRHADRLLEIAELPAQSDGWRRLRLLESLVFAGLSPSHGSDLGDYGASLRTGSKVWEQQ